MFDLFFMIDKLLFQETGSMSISTEYFLAASLSVNACTLIYCACECFQRIVRIRSNQNNLIVNICQVYQTKSQELSKLITEEITVLLSAILGVICICSTDIIRVPFSGTMSQGQLTFVQIVIAINIGRYFYMLFQNTFFLHITEKSRFRTDTVHHIVTLVCYSIILAYKQNLLLGILGILTELNVPLINITKVMKTIGRHKTGTYKKMSIICCSMTVVFRAVIPVLFLIMGMFHETPFMMHYTALTVFFLSIIFFSVINVWLVLSSVQRVIKIYSGNNDIDNSFNMEVSQRQTIEMFRQNNLGYEKPLANTNINHDTDKLNINKKYLPKTNIKSTLQVTESEVQLTDGAQNNYVNLNASLNSTENNLVNVNVTVNSNENSPRRMSINSCSISFPSTDGDTWSISDRSRSHLYDEV